MDEWTELWGEREAVIDRAAREINKFGEACVDTYMSIERLAITADDVARALDALIAREEENEV